jgi:hypothetical protein
MPWKTWQPTSQISAQVVSQCDDNVQALLPREENHKRTIRYQRPTLWMEPEWCIAV